MLSKNITSRIRSERKRKEIEDILESEHPAHFQKVYVVGFLRYGVGLTCEEVTDLILREAKWVKKDRGITSYMVRSVRKQLNVEAALKTHARERACLSSQSSGPSKWIGIVNGAGFTLEWVRVPEDRGEEGYAKP